MANEKTPVTSLYLLQGAVYAFEQCGYLLSDARSLYNEGSYGTAVALTAFAHEELGRAIILLDLRAEVVAGKTIIPDDIRDECDNHVTKQQRGALSTTMRTDRNSGLGKLLEVRLRLLCRVRSGSRPIGKFEKLMRFNESAPRTTDTNSVCAQYMWNPVMMADGIDRRRPLKRKRIEFGPMLQTTTTSGFKRLTPGFNKGRTISLCKN